tara:strand:+ start:1225 stop:3993 length:2769 start_codon:yes stop_codon:yes gene_type:complete
MSEQFKNWLGDNDFFDEIMDVILKGRTIALNSILMPYVTGGAEQEDVDIKSIRRDFIKYVRETTSAEDLAYAILLAEKRDNPETGMAGKMTRGHDIKINAKFLGSTADKETGKFSGTSYKNAVRDEISKYKGFTKFPEPTKRKVLDLFYDYARDSSEGFAIAFEDIASADTIIRDTLKPIVVNLLIDGKTLTVASLLKRKKMSMNKLTLSEKGRENYLDSPVKLNAHISQLEDLIQNYSHLKTNLSVILRKLTSINISGQEDIRKVSVDLMVGSLSLKSLDRRDKIYAYWEKKHSSFNKYINAQDEFIESYEKYLSTERVSEEDMPIILQRIAQLKEYRLVEEDNYIVKVPKQPIDREDRSIQAIMLLGDFLQGYLKDENTFQSVELDSAMAARSDYDEMDVRVESDFDEKSTKTQTDLATREAFGNKTESALFQDIESFKTMKEVDPLFKYVWKSGAFGRVPTFKKDIESLKRRAKKYATKIDIELNETDLSKLADYIDDLEEYATEDEVQDFYYLPLTNKLADEFNISDMDSLIKKLKTHFDIMYDILNLGTATEKEAMPTRATTQVGRTGREKSNKTNQQTYSSLFTGRKGSKLKDVLEEIETEYDDYVDSLIDYVIRPLLSEYMPFDDEPEYVTNKVMDFFMSQEGKEPTAFTTLLARYSEMGTATLSVKGLKRLTELLEEIGNIEPGSRLSSIKSKMELAAKQLDLIFETQHTHDIDVEFGAALQEIKEKNNLNIDVEFNGTPVEKLAEEFEKNRESKLYPLAVLVKHIRKRKGDYIGDDLLNPRAKDLGLGSRGYNAAQEGTSGSRNLVSSFIQSYDNLSKKGLIVKSEFEINLLEAHDSIRKMLDKPVYYGISKLDNFSHVNTAIEKVHEKHSVELTAYDIESIVSETDSMARIAKKYGVSEDAVYYLKGNFRGD